ncbi:hypothetical protein HB779_17495 [Phyllobacterium sp. 628]|uniref:hypothetical protein n=1 Tax=Phyllobacterium sp. 628 TaxID=2718938 RepID=UPI0016622ED7|nr:hypothetical protein [Phyllobacterium sp. 628]QND53482.1 hypothetical protein HB779_17495 [Phyllobacterium sp. 628]
MSRKDDHDRISAMAGVDSNGCIAPPPSDTTIDRSASSNWKTRDYTIPEIPADVRQAAREIVASYLDECGCVDAAKSVRAGRADGNHGVDMATRAILAERERCATVAEALDRQGREWVRDSLWANIKRDTAAAIRRGAK